MSKRNFGITAAIMTAITVAVGVVALSSTVQTALALNNLSANVAHALDMQTSLNAQIKGLLISVLTLSRSKWIPYGSWLSWAVNGKCKPMCDLSPVQ